jgi:hypothetical protein
LLQLIIILIKKERIDAWVFEKIDLTIWNIEQNTFQE